jgi:hypothetical protein
MDAANQQQASSKATNGKRVPGRPWTPGVSGNPSGKRRKTAEDRERERLARIAHDRTVADVQAELKAMVGPAVDKLRRLLDSDDEAIALRAATDIISRVNGLPVATTLLHAEMHSGEGVRKLTADDVKAAAKLYLLRQGCPGRGRPKSS